MNLFECVLKNSSGGGSGADLIVTCGIAFAGATITCTDGGSNTFTETCSSSSPYTATFISIPTGTYTVSGVISGQTYSTTVTITDFTASINATPDGATITPTDDVQTWLHCANIWDKNYTTVSELLADTTSLLALISSNNAVDYMVRSTTWASDICADSTAMTYIGANDYCSDTLLDNSTWASAICDSTYFENVLNVKVPNLSTDSASVINDAHVYSTYGAWYVFNSSANGKNQSWASAKASGTNFAGYSFNENVKVYKVHIRNRDESTSSRIPKAFKIQGFNGTSWVDITDNINNSGGNVAAAISDYVLTRINTNAFSKLRFFVTDYYDQQYVGLWELQFYCRAAS